MDKIFVQNLALRGRHGVEEKERTSEQDFLVDISVEFDTRAAAKSDKLEDTADYSRFCDIARDAVEKNSFYLIERLAETIAQQILADSRIARIEVTIRKPTVLESGVPGITIIRKR